MKKWDRYIHVLGWLLTIIAMAYMVYRLVNYEHYSRLLLTLHDGGASMWIALGVALVLLPVQLHVEALRWQATLRGWKTISIGDSWHQMLVGMLAGFITPYRAGDIPARLLAAGLSMNRDDLRTGFFGWIHDWQKWFKVVGWTIVRYIVWGVQLWAVLSAVGIHLTWTQAVASIAIYYVVISLMPALPAADVALKGGWAVAIFGQYTHDVAAIVLAVSIIWLINTIIPILFGSLEKFLYFCKQKSVNK